jgi:ribose transport system permease protein
MTMGKQKNRMDASMMASVLLLIAVVVFFLVATKGTALTPFSLQNIIDSSIIYVVAGLGLLFVAAQGSADLSVGVNLGISTVLSTGFVMVLGGHDWISIPVTLVLSTALGVLNGWLVGTMKVPSFMVTVAWLLGLRGLIIFLQTVAFGEFDYYISAGALLVLQKNGVKYTVFIVLIIAVFLLLQHTKFGTYCRAIGENELVARNIGIPVKLVKLLAFAMSGLMAGIAGLFYLARNGGTNNTIGQNLEIEVLVCLFAGCILVTGGFGTNISKLLLGCFTFAILTNGLGLLNLSAAFPDIPPQFWKSFPRGLMLILIMFAVIKMKEWEGKRSVESSKEVEAAEAICEYEKEPAVH